MSSIRAWVVEWSCLNPNCILHNIFSGLNIWLISFGVVFLLFYLCLRGVKWLGSCYILVIAFLEYFCCIWLSDCNWIWIHNHLVHKGTLNNLAKPAKWPSCVVSTYLYSAFGCMFLSSHVLVSQWIHTL